VKRLALFGLVSILALSGVERSAAVSPDARGDVELLLQELERIHPNPYHAVPRAELRAAADDLAARLPSLNENQMLVELMRLVARLGERDGHAGVGYLDKAHLYPFYAYRFSDGVFVVAAVNRPGLVGARLVAIAGRPVEDVIRLVEPLMTRDNEMTLRANVLLPLATAEILHGLGVTPAADRATFTFVARNGSRTDLELRPIASSAYTQALQRARAFPGFIYGLPQRARPLFLRRRLEDQWLTTLQRGRVVYLAYRSVVNDTFDTSERLLRLARRPKTKRIVIDLRNNGGGDIKNNVALLDALRSRAVRKKKLVVIIGRETFSAATHFATDVKRHTRAIFVGEPTGGSPNHYSDSDPVNLPVIGVTVFVPTIYYEKMPGQSGLTLEPDVRVQLTARHFFVGRDPVLARALTVRR
jgi:Peptidase family S41